MSLGTGTWKVVATLGSGVLLGAGFAVGFGSLYLFAYPALKAEMDRRMKEVEIQAQEASKSVLLSELQEHHSDGALTIVGLATNSGKEYAGEVVVQADLLNRGAFVDQCSTTLSGFMAPTDSRHFKITCACCGKQPVEHDSYRVSVLGTRWH